MIYTKCTKSIQNKIIFKNQLSFDLLYKMLIMNLRQNSQNKGSIQMFRRIHTKGNEQKGVVMCIRF